jgi:subtilase family serine protease
MIQIRRRIGLALTASMMAVSAYALPTAHPLSTIQERINESSRITLAGNTRPEATAKNDLGALDDATALPSMVMLLKQDPATLAAQKQYIDDLHNPKSANYHQWLTPAQYAEHFGVSQADVATVTAWLQSKGFTINGVQPTGLQIEFSGTAGQVRKAFNTTIHKLSVKGEEHFANFSDPQIPAALASAVHGVISMHDFRPHAMNVRKAPLAKGHTDQTTADGEHWVSAADLATIYNLTPLFQAGISGKGQTIMVLEDTYVYSTADFTTFRKNMGLTRAYPSASFSQVSPTGSTTCTTPRTTSGITGYAANGDDGEAILDAEWATAAAPNATIVLAACRSGTLFGGQIALLNALNSTTVPLPSVVSMSYGEAEATGGATLNASFNTTFAQAVTEGVSIFVSSGDELAESADNGNVATHGIGISGWASTPYNVAVGGTDFGGPVAGDPTVTWSTTNGPNYSSALGYMTETPWNGSCANTYVWESYANTTTYTTPALWCASTDVTSTSSNNNFFDGAFGGSGGPSGCATGKAATSGVVGGTCAPYAKPSWQSVLGNPADSVRDIPDVSLFASNGILGAVYPVCWSNPSTSDTGNTGGFNCNGDPSTWAGFGGTSISSPIMAAIQALVNQHTGSRWGNPNTVYYAMAATEYGATGSAACNSSTVNKTGPNSCVFYDITQGDIQGVCTGARNCYVVTGATVGVSSTTQNPTFTPAYNSTVGWDFATGLGSVNAYNLVMNWAGVH